MQVFDRDGKILAKWGELLQASSTVVAERNMMVLKSVMPAAGNDCSYSRYTSRSLAVSFNSCPEQTQGRARRERVRRGLSARLIDDKDSGRIVPGSFLLSRPLAEPRSAAAGTGRYCFVPPTCSKYSLACLR